MKKIEGLIDKVIKGMDLLPVPHYDRLSKNHQFYMDAWEWPQGVCLFALYLYYKDTNNSEILEYLTKWFDHQISVGLPEKNVNTMCPMLTLAHLYEETKNEKYLAYCKEWGEYAMKHLPRTEEGGIQHIVTGHRNDGELWDDTLYMTVLFLTKLGMILKNEDYTQESIRQFLVHIKYLSDVETGLFFHGWTFIEKNHFARALWARGNSWYTAGLVDYLDIIELPLGVKVFLLTTLQRQVEKLAELQAEDGMWHTLLDDADSYVETSATAGFAYGILKGVRLGYLDEKYREVGLKAYEAVLPQIAENGVVQNVSYGTGMGRTLQEYRDIPICPQPYGQSLVLLLLVEVLKHQRDN